MSIADVKPYFRSRLNALELKEWSDPFNFANIPETLLDRSYHLQLGTVTQSSVGQQGMTLNVPITLRVFFRGFNKPLAAYDKASVAANDIILDCLDPLFRATQTNGIKNVLLGSSDILPLDVSNDNSMYVEQSYNVMILICP
jgi:hypothetical protein